MSRLQPERSYVPSPRLLSFYDAFEWRFGMLDEVAEIEEREETVFLHVTIQGKMEMRMGTSIGEFDRFVDKLPEKVRRSPWLMFIPVTKNNASDDPKERAPKKDKHRLNPEDGRRRMENGKNVGIVLRDQLSIPDVIDEEEAGVYLEDLP